jgi:hypothetical protein
VSFVIVPLLGVNPLGANNTHVLIFSTNVLQLHVFHTSSSTTTEIVQFPLTSHVAIIQFTHRVIHHHTIHAIFSLVVTVNSTLPLVHTSS